VTGSSNSLEIWASAKAVGDVYRRSIQSYNCSCDTYY